MAYIKKGTLPYRIDIKGQKFGRLLVLEYAYTDKNTYWKCICDCGKEHITQSRNLRNGYTASCGCLKRELDIAKCTKHGMCYTRMNGIWRHMLGRCENINDDGYKWYGAIGIKVCERWHEFINFYNDMKDGYADNLSIDRINGRGNYEPSNCRWATPKQQARNISTNIFLEYNGERLTPGGWADKLGVRYGLIRNRIRYGWAVERILTEPIHTECHKNEFKNKQLLLCQQ